MITLEVLNAMAAAEFVATLAAIFEHSPWVARGVAELRPFNSVLHLHEAMCAAVMRAGADEQMALIRAHPELAGRAAVQGELTPESAREQQGAGLSACTPDEFHSLKVLNAAYVEKFAFPFIIAVRGHTPASVIAALQARLAHDIEAERLAALEQIGRIAAFRLADLIEEPLGHEILSKLDYLARFSERDGELTCSYLSAAHRATAGQLKYWMLAAGLKVRIDALGNVIGRLPAAADNAPVLMTGSHYDTVVNAGKYDGRLGIVLPIVVAAQLKRRGIALPFALDIVGFAEEEGVRFKSTFLGSSAVAGKFDTAVLANVDSDGLSMREAMHSAGLDPDAIVASAVDPQGLLGFVEVHIEQGPVLLSEDRPVGVVTSIAGSVRALLTVVGLAGHAGTVPMHLRRDAAAAAAEIVLAVEKRCRDIPGLVGTVGRLEVLGGAVNVIPGRCDLSIDIRSDDNGVRDAAFADVVAQAELIAMQRKVQIRIRKVLEIGRVPCSNAMQQRWAESIKRVTGTAQVRYLPSGAGHDAMVMAQVTEMAMLFVRCGNDGISHHPEESLSEADADVAARVFTDFLENFSD